MNSKKAVTLITLTVTVVILAVLTASVIINVENIFPEAKKAKFAEDLKKVEDGIREYYLTYGHYPVDSATAYTKSEVVALNTSSRGELLSDEIDKNGDKESEFYLVDLDKIRVTAITYGNVVSEDDIFVAATLTGNVYYVKGIVQDGTARFSLRSYEMQK